MKTTILILSILLLATVTNAQEKTGTEFQYIKNFNGWHLQLKGHDSQNVIDSLFAHHPKKKRVGHIWKFRKMKISGIDELVTLQVHEGVRGGVWLRPDSLNCSGSSYFLTFRNKKDKKEKITNLKPSESLGAIVYIRMKKSVTKEQAKLVEDYLQNLLG